MECRSTSNLPTATRWRDSGALEQPSGRAGKTILKQPCDTPSEIWSLLSPPKAPTGACATTSNLSGRAPVLGERSVRKARFLAEVLRQKIFDNLSACVDTNRPASSV